MERQAERDECQREMAGSDRQGNVQKHVQKFLISLGARFGRIRKVQRGKPRQSSPRPNPVPGRKRKVGSRNGLRRRPDKLVPHNTPPRRHRSPPAPSPAAGTSPTTSSVDTLPRPPMPRFQYFTAYRLSSSFRILLYVPMSRMCSVRKLLVTLRWKQQ